MIQFILNKQLINTSHSAGMVVLDFVRYEQRLTGTKIGCREGDCGACTVLVGELMNGQMVYRSVTSCLLPLGGVHGKHVVTVEGLNMDALNPIQQAIHNEAATQCGFCTPGFVVSLAGFCLSPKEPDYANAIASIDGNICRCTGYKSIEKAAASVSALLKERKGGEPVLYATLKKILPGYFNNIKDRLQQLKAPSLPMPPTKANGVRVVGGGTDLYVQQHEQMVDSPIRFVIEETKVEKISRHQDTIVLSGSATVSHLIDSPMFREHFPEIGRFVKLVSSTPIRNVATIAGNFINASPIGDLSVFFLVLDAQLHLAKGSKARILPLRNLFVGYKKLNLKEGEIISKIAFQIPAEGALFNFEKVSKRTHLDIASVNSAISLVMDGDQIMTAGLAAGGVAPVPLYLQKSAAFLQGKTVSENLVHELIAIALTEIAPISDARGSAAYKSQLLQQLIKAHFITLFPALCVEKLLKVLHEEY